jgi:hypothetical protein
MSLIIPVQLVLLGIGVLAEIFVKAMMIVHSFTPFVPNLRDNVMEKAYAIQFLAVAHLCPILFVDVMGTHI